MFLYRKLSAALFSQANFTNKKISFYFSYTFDIKITFLWKIFAEISAVQIINEKKVSIKKRYARLLAAAAAAAQGKKNDVII